MSLPLLAAIWWWTERRSRQAPGNPQLRESTPPLEARYPHPPDRDLRPHPPAGDWGVSPFEPLSIRTAEFDPVPALDGPLHAHADPEADPDPEAEADPDPDPEAEPGQEAHDAGAKTDLELPGPPGAAEYRRSAAAVPTASSADLKKIVTIRVCCVGQARWSGAQLASALESQGLALGRYQVFHRNHPDGRSLFCVASLIEPGTFDAARMPLQEFRGVTLFAVLPGPLAPLATMDQLMGTARGLAEELTGMVQDGKGTPMSPQRAAGLREEVARFQALLPRNASAGS